MTPEHAVGSIVIPANAIAAFRKTLSGTVNRLHDAIYDHAAALHHGHGGADSPAYLQAVREDTRNRRKRMYTSVSSGGTTPEMDEYLYVLAATERLLERLTQDARRPIQPTHTDVDLIAPRPTMHDRSWRATTPDGITVMTIRIDGRIMSIGTVRAVNAVTAAQLAPLGVTMLDALSEMRWTRGSGGTITTRREDGTDAEVLRYGPLGASAGDQ